MTLKRLSVILSCFMFAGCWFSSHPVPISPGESQFSKPVQKPFKLSATRKIKWNEVPADSIHQGRIVPFDISKLSSGQKILTYVNMLADEYLRLSYHGLRARDKSFNAQFVMDFDEKFGELLLVQQDIGRVLLNLFNNAFYSVTEKKK